MKVMNSEEFSLSQTVDEPIKKDSILIQDSI